MKALKDLNRVVMWTAGILILLGLNVRRDLSRTLGRYTWDNVQQKTLYRTVSSPGVMEAVEVVTIKSLVDETVEKVSVAEGDQVKKNQPLMGLTRTNTQLEYEQKRNNYMNALSDSRKAERELAVQKKLLKSLAVSKSDVEEAEANLERSLGNLNIVKGDFELTKQKLNSTALISPMDGVVLKLQSKVGNRVAPGNELITVGDISKFVVRAKVDELDIQHVKVDQPVRIRADAYPDHIFNGVVQSIAMQAEREVFGKFEVIVQIVDAKDLLLKHNLSVRADIMTEVIPNAIGIPSKSVIRKKGDYGWVLVRNRLNLVKEKKIKLGRPAGDDIEVVSGLSTQDRVGFERIDFNDL